MSDEPAKGKAPAFQFYPADYERDVACLSLAAQGLWVRMLCKMHWRNGYLEHPTGAAFTPDDLARSTGHQLKLITALLAEMERCGIFSRDEAGVIFCRRMVRDRRISSVRSAAGKRGGNPNLVKQEVNQNSSKPQANSEEKVNPKVGQVRKQNPTPSSSSSGLQSSSSTSQTDPDVNAEGFGVDQCGAYEFFRENFIGEVPDDLWRYFNQWVQGDSAELLLANLPLWMQTRKYANGFGSKAVDFLKSGIWKKPPRHELIHGAKSSGQAYLDKLAEGGGDA